MINLHDSKACFIPVSGFTAQIYKKNAINDRLWKSLFTTCNRYYITYLKTSNQGYGSKLSSWVPSGFEWIFDDIGYSFFKDQFRAVVIECELFGKLTFFNKFGIRLTQ